MTTDNPDTVPMDIEVVRPKQRLEVQFTGSGSEYFRIWIVNLMLTLVTFGIYYPWAKARKLRYFWENTLVDGDPLGFHGTGEQFFRGNMIAGLMLSVYSFAARLSPTGALVALLVLAAVWPVLLRASMCFRMRNTSWRGVRLAFKGTVPGAYRGVLPLWIPVIAMGVLGASMPTTPGATPSAWALLPVAVAVLALPAAFYGFKRYQHGGFCLADERSQLTATMGSFFSLGFKLIGVGLLAGGALVLVMVFLGLGLSMRGQASEAVASAGGLLAIPALLFVNALVFSFFQSRLQNLVWGNTKSAHFQFHSNLKLVPLALVRMKNWLLIGLTVGLYWPFAAVSLYRIRVESVAAKSTIDLSQLLDLSTERFDNATGDSAGEFFGLDLGL